MVHLVKLCVGCPTPEDLSTSEHRRDQTAQQSPSERIHVTRNRPRRAEELLASGSLYWVMAGNIRCRQRIIGLRQTIKGVHRACAIVLDANVHCVQHCPRRPFQGWRYLEDKDAPGDVFLNVAPGDSGGQSVLPWWDPLGVLGVDPDEGREFTNVADIDCCGGVRAEK